MAKVWTAAESPILRAFDENDESNPMIHALESMHDGIVVLDKDMGIVWLNREMEKKHGKLGMAKGKKCHEVFHDEKELCDNCPSKKTLKTGKKCSIVIKMKGRSIELLTSPLKDKESRTVAVLELVRELNKEKKPVINK